MKGLWQQELLMQDLILNNERRDCSFLQRDWRGIYFRRNNSNPLAAECIKNGWMMGLEPTTLRITI